MANERPVVLISGSSSGIGAASAVRFASEGFNVVINYARNEMGAERTRELCARHGADTCVVRARVEVDEECNALVEAARSRWGRLDTLVNNAGTTRYVPEVNFAALKLDDFQRACAVNVAG